MNQRHCKIIRTLIGPAIMVLLSGPCFAQGNIKYGPYVSQATTTSIAITWITNKKTSDNKVIWGTDSPVTEAPENSSEKNPHENLWNHVVHLEGLTANTDYVYKVISDGSESEEYPFRSAVNWGEPFSFGYAADNQDAAELLSQQLDFGMNKGIRFQIFGGDLIGDAGSIINPNWENAGWEDNLFIPANTHPNPYGNTRNFMASHGMYTTTSWHDLGLETEGPGYDHFPFFWTFPANGPHPEEVNGEGSNYRQEYLYAFGYGNTYFICINGTGGAADIDGPVWRPWLEEQLKIGKEEYAFRVVFGHTGNNHGNGDLFSKYDVNVRFRGHKHEYSHSQGDGIDVICGPPSLRNEWAMVSVDSEKMQFTAYDKNRGIMDEVEWDADPDVEAPVVRAVHKEISPKITLARSGNNVSIRMPQWNSASNVSIYDAQGRQTASLNPSEEMIWDVSGVSRGMYFMNLGGKQIKLPVY